MLKKERQRCPRLEWDWLLARMVEVDIDQSIEDKHAHEEENDDEESDD